MSIRVRMLFLATVTSTGAFLAQGAADVLTVPGDYPTINSAISAAVSGDRIEVSAGTYPELVLIDGVRLEVVAVDGPGSTEIVAPSAFARCVLVSGVGSSDSRIEGFTLRDGFPFDLGGGMRISGGARGIEIVDCILASNSAASSGGGAAVSDDSTVRFADCIFRGNEAGTQGGGLFIAADGGFTIERCRFEGNTAGGDGGGACIGAPTLLDEAESFPRVLNSIFSGNTAGGSGGGAYILSARIDCGVPGGCYVGGAYGCTFSRNVATFGGAIDGGAAFQGSPLNVVNCILSGNSGDYAVQEILGLEVVFTPDFLECNIDFAGDAAPRFVLELGPDEVAGTGDEVLQLLPGSPCIDAGYVYAGDSAVLNGDFDVAGGTRRIDSTYTVDTGTTEGPLPIVDIGAHEFDDDVVVGSVAVWTGSGGSFTAPSNWYAGGIPQVGVATWLDGPADPGIATTLRGGATIGELYVNTGDWSITGTSSGSPESIAIRRPGGKGPVPGSIFIAPYDGDRASLELRNLSLSCDNLVLARGDFDFGPADGGEDVSIDATGVVIATDSETRLPSAFRGSGSVVTSPILTLPSFWNLGITQPTGPLAIDGNYYQSGGTTFPDTLGRLRFDLADPTQSLAVTGAAVLGGPVEFVFDPLDPPSLEVGQSFTIRHRWLRRHGLRARPDERHRRWSLPHAGHQRRDRGARFLGRRDGQQRRGTPAGRLGHRHHRCRRRRDRGGRRWGGRPRSRAFRARFDGPRRNRRFGGRPPEPGEQRRGLGWLRRLRIGDRRPGRQESRRPRCG